MPPQTARAIELAALDGDGEPVLRRRLPMLAGDGGAGDAAEAAELVELDGDHGVDGVGAVRGDANAVLLGFRPARLFRYTNTKTHIK